MSELTRRTMLGVTGAGTALDAATRGLRTGLVEARDFASGTSSRSSKLFHGGLRYLQTLDLRRARESVRERRALARIAPWAVAPLPFVLPLYPSLMKGPLAMRAGFLLDRLVAHDRNDGPIRGLVTPDCRSPRMHPLDRLGQHRQLPLRAAAIGIGLVHGPAI